MVLAMPYCNKLSGSVGLRDTLALAAFRIIYTANANLLREQVQSTVLWRLIHEPPLCVKDKYRPSMVSLDALLRKHL